MGNLAQSVNYQQHITKVAINVSTEHLLWALWYKPETVMFNAKGISVFITNNNWNFWTYQIGNFHPIFGKYRPFFYWEWGRILAPKMPLKNLCYHSIMTGLQVWEDSGARYAKWRITVFTSCFSLKSFCLSTSWCRSLSRVRAMWAFNCCRRDSQ